MKITQRNTTFLARVLDAWAAELFLADKTKEAVAKQEEALKLLDGKDGEFIKLEDVRQRLEKYRKESIQ